MSFFNRKKDEVNTSVINHTINYTDHYEPDSSLIWDVWYNAADQTATVNLEGVLYKYTEVPETAVSYLVDAVSPGREFRHFKNEYGPSQKLGYESEVSKVRAQASAYPGVVPKNLTYAPDARVTDVTLHTSDPKTVPLKTGVAPEPTSLPKRTHTVHFESNGSRTYTLEASSVEQAVEALQEVANMLGVSAKVTGVFVHLG